MAFVLTQPEVLLVIVLEQVTKETRVKMVSTAELHLHVQNYERILVVLSFFHMYVYTKDKSGYLSKNKMCKQNYLNNAPKTKRTILLLSMPAKSNILSSPSVVQSGLVGDTKARSSCDAKCPYCNQIWLTNKQ